MRIALALTLTFAVVSSPAVARADDLSGCFLGPTDVSRCTISGAPAAILAGIGATVLVAGAASTIAGELQKRHEEQLPAGDDPATSASTPQKGARPSLALLPTLPDPYREAAGTPERRRHSARNPAVDFNETATNVGLAVGGAMVLGAAIATIVKAAK
jgi:hypothetical protein